MATTGVLGLPATPPAAPAEPAGWLALPGFMPGAVAFSLRAALALVLAYGVSFWMQLGSAASAGICVAIVMQPQPGMALSKAAYRTAGTLIGCAAAILVIAAFPQDRTLLLMACIAWLALCTVGASLLRDFRAYGAVLAGYTVGIVAIGGIDAPDATLLYALDRVAAILVGIACVALVNSLLAPAGAFQDLVRDLGRAIDDITGLALQALDARMRADDVACARRGAGVLGLQTLATYAAAELPDGARRSAGARSAIAALLAVLAETRAIANLLRLGGSEPPPAGHPAAGAYLDQVADAIRHHRPAPPVIALPERPIDAALIERGAALAADCHRARIGFRVLTGAAAPEPVAPVRLRIHHDVFGALLGGLRVIIAVGAGAVFCIYAGWPGATLLLIQQSAFTALFGMQPNPGAAALNAARGLPLPALAAGIVGFVLLPAASGFVPFAVAVGGAMFLIALAGRYARTLTSGPSLMLYFALLLAPNDVESFSLVTFLNNVLVQALAVLFMAASFRLVLPVSPSRRLFRLTQAAMDGLRRTLRGGHRSLDQPAEHSISYDRLAQALAWTSGGYGPRPALIRRLYGLSELDIALRRAWSGLQQSGPVSPELAAAVADGVAGLTRSDPSAMERAAGALLAHPHAARSPASVLRAASGLFGAARLLHAQHRALLRYGLSRTLADVA